MEATMASEVTIMAVPSIMHIDARVMRKSCDVTFVIKTLRKHIEGGRIDLSNFDWNQRIMLAGIDGFT